MRCEPEYVGPSVALGPDPAEADGTLATLQSVSRRYTRERRGFGLVNQVGRPGLEPGTLGLKVPCSNPMS